MSEKGYITIQRKITEWRWWGNPNAMSLWLYILVKANWQDRWWDRGKEMVKRGEFITSQVKIAEDLNMNRRTVTKYLKLFAEEGQIELKVDNRKTLIKVINYAKYQDVPDDDAQLDAQLTAQVNAQQSTQQTAQQSTHNRTNITIKPLLQKEDYYSNTSYSHNNPRKSNPKNGNQHLVQWFEEFWKLYPRKEGKQNAMKAFEKMCNSEDTYNAIMDGLQKRVKLDWSRRPPEEKKFIPHPSSWLNQSRWLDEVTPYAGKGEGIFAGMTGKPEDYKETSAEYEKSIEEFFGE